MGIDEDRGEDLAFQAGGADLVAIADEALEVGEGIILGHRHRVKVRGVRQRQLSGRAAERQNAQKR